MNKDYAISIFDSEQETTMLKIATHSKNSSMQIFSERMQIFTTHLDDLQKKIEKKLGLHGIKNFSTQVSLSFANDKVEDFGSFEDFLKYDFKRDYCTESLRIRWTFLFDSSQVGEPNLHCISLRFSETPAPGVFLQRILSSRAMDADEGEPDFFSPTVCKLDFADSTFANELFSVIGEWIKAQPKAEPAFDFVTKLIKYEDSIVRLVEFSVPAMAIIAYVGIWIGVLPEQTTSSVKNAVAWALGGIAVLVTSQYLAATLKRIIETAIRKIALIPIFRLTAGDNNRVTRYLAKSQKSTVGLIVAGVTYGLAQAIGLFFAKKILDHMF